MRRVKFSSRITRDSTGAAYLPSDRSVATHVQLVYPARRGQSEVIQTVAIDQLGNFRRDIAWGGQT